MNLAGKRVVHKQFGTGTVASLQGDVLCVEFDSVGGKSFVYPDGFEQHLKAEDSAVDARIRSNIAAHRKAQQQERDEKRRQELLRQEQERQQALELAKQKRRTTKTAKTTKSPAATAAKSKAKAS